MIIVAATSLSQSGHFAVVGQLAINVLAFAKAAEVAEKPKVDQLDNCRCIDFTVRIFDYCQAFVDEQRKAVKLHCTASYWKIRSLNIHVNYHYPEQVAKRKVYRCGRKKCMYTPSFETSNMRQYHALAHTLPPHCPANDCNVVRSSKLRYLDQMDKDTACELINFPKKSR